MLRWLGFTGALCGGLYFFLLLAVVLHEILGHGLAALLLGGRFVSFSINPGLGGWAHTGGVPQEQWWIVDWAGIAVEALLGLIALGLLLLRRRHLNAWNMVLFLLAVTELGGALGYALQGFLFLKGDAGPYAERLAPVLRHVGTGVLALLLLALVFWGLRRALLFLEEHYEPRSTLQRRLWLVASVAAPIVAMMFAKPSVKLFDRSERIAFQAALVVGVVVVAFWLTARAPRGADPAAARRPSALAGLLWFALAGLSYAGTELWLRDGVQF